MVKAIAFDCWDTLIDDGVSRTKKRKEYFRRIFNEKGFPISEAEMDELFSKQGF